MESKSLPAKRRSPSKLNVKFSDDKETTTTVSVSAESATQVGATEQTAAAPQDNPTVKALPSPKLKIRSIMKEPNASMPIEHDNGEASENPHQDLIRVLQMVSTERHLTAHELYRQVLSRIRNENQQKKEDEEYKANLELARKYHEENKKQFENLEKRAKLFTRAKRNLAIDDDWTKAQTLFGITTYYRREADKTLSVKMEGVLHGVPIFEQLAVLKEIDLYHTWAPFCSSSKCVAALTKCDTIGHVMCGFPSFGLYRDACFRAVACDSMNEDGSIIIVAESIGQIDPQSNQEPVAVPEALSEDDIDDDVSYYERKDEKSTSDASSQISAKWNKKFEIESSQEQLNDESNNGMHQERTNLSRGHLSSQLSSFIEEDNDDDDDDDLPNSFLSEDDAIKDIPLPPPPSGYGAARMNIHRFEAEIDVLSPTSARTRLVSNVDPNIALPKWLLDFILKKMCGVLLNRLQSAAKRTLKDPVSPHARRMRENSEFYRHWLWHKFAKYCDDLGWEMPTVRAFEVDEEKLDIDEWMKYDSQNIKIKSIMAGDVDSVTSSLLSKTPSTPSEQSTNSGKSNQSNKQVWFPLSPKWDQRAEELRIRKIATARRKAKLRMRPKKLTPEQEIRLQALKEAKRRFEGKTDSSDCDDDSYSSDTASVSSSRSMYSKDSDRSKKFITFSRPSKLGIFLNILSGGHPKILPYMTLPFILPLTFFVFYKYSKEMNHMLLQHHANKSVAIEQYLNDTDLPIIDILAASSVETTNSKFSLSELLWYKFFSLIIILIITVYNFLFWATTCSLFVWAFDAIEIPGLVGEYKTKMTNVRRFYVQKVQTFTLYGSLAITALSFARAIAVDIFRRLCNHSILYWEVGYLHWNSWMNTLKDNIDISNSHLSPTNNVLVNLLENSTIMLMWKFCSKHGRMLSGEILKHMTTMGNSLMQHHLVALFVNVVSVTFWSILVGSRQILNLLQVLLYSQTETFHKPWIINAIDYTKFSMIYITLFLSTALMFCLVFIPKRKAPKQPPVKRITRQPSNLHSIPETIERSDSDLPKLMLSHSSTRSAGEVEATGSSHDVKSNISIDDSVKSTSNAHSWKRKISKKMKLKSKKKKTADTNGDTKNEEFVNSAVTLDYSNDPLSNMSTQGSTNSLCSELTQDSTRSNKRRKHPRIPFGRKEQSS